MFTNPEISPTRSRTDPPAPQQKSIRQRLHANTLDKIAGGSNPSRANNHHHHQRHAAKDAVAELKPPIIFDNLRRRERKDVDSNAKEAPNSHLEDIATAQIVEPVKRKATHEDVARARRDNTNREKELRASLDGVEQIGMKSTRTLDETYYAILEKASILRSTIASLQQLASESKKMHSSFKEESASLQDETERNIETFGNFNQQEQTINDLVGKLQDSRKQTGILNDRLESARLRVEAYEQRDDAQQAKRRAQWHMAWLSLLGVVVLIVAILVARDRERVGEAVEHQLLRIGDLVEDVAAPRSRPSPSEDPFLSKLFDDL